MRHATGLDGSDRLVASAGRRPVFGCSEDWGKVQKENKSLAEALARCQPGACDSKTPYFLPQVQDRDSPYLLHGRFPLTDSGKLRRCDQT